MKIPEIVETSSKFTIALQCNLRLIRVFLKNTQSCRCCQLCILIYLLLPPYLTIMILVNMELDSRRYQRITFQGCIFHWSALFLIAQPKQGSHMALCRAVNNDVARYLCRYLGSNLNQMAGDFSF